MENRLSLRATANMSSSDKPKPWRCLPPGVTLEYYRGEPLGKVMMTVAGGLEKEQFSQAIDVIAVGDRLSLRPSIGRDSLSAE